MQISTGGNLILHCIDLEGWDTKDLPGSKDRLVSEERCADLRNFTCEAQIAAAYALMAGYKVGFQSRNDDFSPHVICDVEPRGSRYCWPKEDWRKW